MEVEALEARLLALTELAPYASLPGAGAAGGLGAALASLGAELVAGAELVLDEIGFDPRGFDLVVTGDFPESKTAVDVRGPAEAHHQLARPPHRRNDLAEPAARRHERVEPHRVERNRFRRLDDRPPVLELEPARAPRPPERVVHVGLPPLAAACERDHLERSLAAVRHRQLDHLDARHTPSPPAERGRRLHGTENALEASRAREHAHCPPAPPPPAARASRPASRPA